METRAGVGEKKGKEKMPEIVPEEDEEEGEEEDEEEKRKRTNISGQGPARKGSSSVQTLSCQADNCGADLTNAKRYHRRHKVCELHSKAAIVVVAGLRQRFCQQCSRFHELTEFDETKRSCRRRLAGHNERRRKNTMDSQVVNTTSQKDNQCRPPEEAGGMQITLPGSPTYKHFQIR